MPFTLSCLLLLSLAICIYTQEQQLVYDAMSTATASNWNFGDNYNSIIPSTSTDCYYDSCFELRNGGWVERTFSTTGFQNIYFAFFINGKNQGTLNIYVYDSNLEISSKNKNFNSISAPKTVNPSTTSLWDDISSFKIRFELHQNTGAFFDSLSIYGTPIRSLAPTSQPTFHPTSAPSTTAPTSDPTMNPMIKTTIVPIANTTTVVPVNVVNATNAPTTYPTYAPSIYPTDAPTVILVDGNRDGNVDKNEISSTSGFEHNNDENRGKITHNVLSDGYLTGNWYYLVGILLIFIIVICFLIICLWQIQKLNRNIVADEKDTCTDNIMSAAVANQAVKEFDSRNIKNNDIEMQNIAIGSLSTSMHMRDIVPVVETTMGLTDENMNNVDDMNTNMQLIGESQVILDAGETAAKPAKPANSVDNNDNDDDDGLYETSDDNQTDDGNELDETKGNTLGGTTRGNEFDEVNSDSETNADYDKDDNILKKTHGEDQIEAQHKENED